MAEGVPILETTVSTGTGNLTLTNKSGYLDFNTEFGTGGTDVFWYEISSLSYPGEFEKGTAHLSTSTTFVRDTVIESSNNNNLVDFSEGEKVIIFGPKVSAGVTDHGALTGLTDDDHTQYSLVDGTRSYTGDVTIAKSTPTFTLEDTAGTVDWSGSVTGGIHSLAPNTLDYLSNYLDVGGRIVIDDTFTFGSGDTVGVNDGAISINPDLNTASGFAFQSVVPISIGGAWGINSGLSAVQMLFCNPTVTYNTTPFGSVSLFNFGGILETGTAAGVLPSTTVYADAGTYTSNKSAGTSGNVTSFSGGPTFSASGAGDALTVGTYTGLNLAPALSTGNATASVTLTNYKGINCAVTAPSGAGAETLTNADYITLNNSTVPTNLSGIVSNIASGAGRFFIEHTGSAVSTFGGNVSLTGSSTLTLNSTAAVSGILDEDDMSSDSATDLATQQSIKAYTDTQSSGSWILLETQTASNSASIELTTGIDSTYDHYIIECIDVIPVGANDAFELNVSDDGGTTYESGASDYEYANISIGAGSGSVQAFDDSAHSSIRLNGNTGLSNASDQSFNATIHMWSPSNTSSRKTFTYTASYEDNSGVMRHVTGSARFVGNTSAIDALEFTSAAGNISSGTFRLYGVKK